MNVTILCVRAFALFLAIALTGFEIKKALGEIFLAREEVSITIVDFFLVAIAWVVFSATLWIDV